MHGDAKGGGDTDDGAGLPQDAHLMSKGNEPKFKVAAAMNTEREQGHESGKNRDRVRNGMAAHNSLGFLNASKF